MITRLRESFITIVIKKNQDVTTSKIRRYHLVKYAVNPVLGFEPSGGLGIVLELGVDMLEWLTQE